MPLIERQNLIIDYLKKSNNFITSNELASYFNVTTRTIRNDIKIIKDEFGENFIESNKTKGYKINKKENDHIFFDFDANNPNQRILYIVKELLINPFNKINIFDIAEELYISERSIETDIFRLKKIIYEIEDNINIIRQGYDVFLQIPNDFQYNLLYDIAKFINPKLKLYHFQQLFNNINLDYLYNIIVDELNSYTYESRYLSINRLTLDVCLIIDSIHKYQCCYGDKFQKFNEHYFEKNKQELAKRLVNSIYKKLNIKIQHNNYIYLATILNIHEEMHIIEANIRNQPIDKDDFYNVCINILSSLKQKKGIDLISNDKLTNDFIYHIKIAMKRMQLGIKLKNPLSEKISKEYTYIIDSAIFIADMLYQAYNIQMDYNEISFIAIYLATAVQTSCTSNNNNKVKILLFVPDGISTLTLLNQAIESNFDNNIIIDGTTNLNILDNLENTLEKYDLVITTSNRIIINNPKLHIISNHFNNNEIMEIKNIINDLINNKNNSFLIDKYQKFFDNRLFFKDIDLNNKNDAIDFLVDNLIDCGYVNQDFKEGVIKREAVVSTELDSSVALPHSIYNNALNSVMAILFLKSPIIWDKKKIKYIFMFANDGKSNEDKNEFLLQIMDLVSNPSSIKNIQNSENIDDIILNLIKSNI